MKPHDRPSLTSPRTLTDSLTDLPSIPAAVGSAGEGGSRLDEDFIARYRHGDSIGEGGMGEVRLVGDGRIGREVAMKVARATSEGSRRDQELRFLREARIQGQLEHPSIVPVYDLGRDPTGTQYFTMKRVHGLTLEAILARLADGEPDALERFSLRKLLTAFGSVCLAVDFAHARGVLHRDLKPANIMLGDFGEVYVLDWGLAKVVGVADEAAAPAVVDAPSIGNTAVGAMLGTPGYMAPEQVRGEVDRLDARTDVYSLGAILFEILTLTPLHTRASVAEIIASTLSTPDTRAAARAPEREVPPELEAVCERATRLDPAQRLPSARALNAAIERFLDGDRDLALRRDLACAHAESAREAADGAIEGGLVEERRRALREVGRALALDPRNDAAKGTLMRLMTAPPRTLPPSAVADTAVLAQTEQRAAARIGIWVYLSWLLVAPVALWMGVRSWWSFGFSGAMYLASAAACWWMSYRPNPKGKVSLPLLLASALAVASTGFTFGPFLVLPSIATVNAMTFMMARDSSRRILVVAVSWLAFLGPLGLEWAGVLPHSYAFRDGTIALLPNHTAFPPLPTLVFLVGVNVLVMGTACLLIARLRDVLTATDRRLQLHLWQLRQLVPDEAHAAVQVPISASDPSCTLGGEHFDHLLGRARRGA